MQCKRFFLLGVFLLAFFVFLSVFSFAQAMDQLNVVSITGSGFDPDNVSILQGTTVTWSNGNGNGVYSRVHRIVSDSSNDVYSPDLQSGDLALGDTYSFTFNVPGSFGYHSAADPSMGGVVNVAPLVTVTTTTTPMTITAVTTFGPVFEAKTYMVYVRDYAFVPQNLTVGKGSTVVWVNNDGSANYQVYHGIEADHGSNPDSYFHSGPLGLGGVFGYTFNMPGVYGYHCSIYPWMGGTIAVSPEEVLSTTSTTQTAVTTTTSSTLPAVLQTVVINGVGFVPSDVTVPVGSTVMWINDGPGFHRVVSSNDLHVAESQEPASDVLAEKEFASDKLNIGDIFSNTFVRAGVYYYIDDLHPSMAGKITVK